MWDYPTPCPWFCCRPGKFFGWISQEVHSEPHLLLALFYHSTPSCLKVYGWRGWVVCCGDPCDFRVSPFRLDFGTLDFWLWTSALGLTIFFKKYQKRMENVMYFMGHIGRFSLIEYPFGNHSIIQGYPDDLFLGNVQCHLHYQAGLHPRAQSQSTSFHQTTSRPRCPESLQPMPLFLLTI